MDGFHANKSIRANSYIYLTKTVKASLLTYLPESVSIRH